MFWFSFSVIVTVFTLLLVFIFTLEVGRGVDSSKWSKKTDRLKHITPVRFTLPEHIDSIDEQLLVTAIVEPRDHDMLIPCIKNIRTVLSTTMYIYVFHGPTSLLKLIDEFGDDPYIVRIPLDVNNMSIAHYNNLLTRLDFWDVFNSKYVLITQTDAVLFRRSRMNIYDYIEKQYDYVGAPFRLLSWDTFRLFTPFSSKYKSTNCGNGGLSLRKVCTMKKVVQEIPYLSIPFEPEDVYFSYAFHEFNKLHPQQYILLPSKQDAAKLFFEHMDSDELPFGAHKYLPRKWIHLMEDDEIRILDINYRTSSPELNENNLLENNKAYTE